MRTAIVLYFIAATFATAFYLGRPDTSPGFNLVLGGFIGFFLAAAIWVEHAACP